MESKYSHLIYDILLEEGEKTVHELRDAIDARIYKIERDHKGRLADVLWCLLKVQPNQLRSGLTHLRDEKTLNIENRAVEGKREKKYLLNPEACIDQILPGEFQSLIDNVIGEVYFLRGQYICIIPKENPNKFLVLRQFIQRELDLLCGTDEIMIELLPSDDPNMRELLFRLKDESK